MKNKFEFTLSQEGCTDKNPVGYVNDPQDAGGETVAGISRRYHPQWEGWKFVDEIKKATVSPFDLIKALDTTEIHNAIYAFYKQYWHKYKCDEMPIGLGIAMFDTAFMTGQAVRLLQMSINFVVEDKINMITVDNVIGMQTLSAIELIRRASLVESLVNVYIYKRIVYQMELRDKRKFYRGWAERAGKLGFYLYKNKLL